MAYRKFSLTLAMHSVILKLHYFTQHCLHYFDVKGSRYKGPRYLVLMTPCPTLPCFFRQYFVMFQQKAPDVNTVYEGYYNLFQYFNISLTRCGTTFQLNWWGRPHSRNYESNIICLCMCVCVVLVLDSVTCIFGYGT